jgi:hypothetical protein
MEWNERDELVSLTGAPIHLDQTVPQDPEMHALVEKLKAPFQYKIDRVLTVAEVDFPPCRGRRDEKCAIARLISECIHEAWPSANAAWTNVGGLRASLVYPASSL